MAGYLNEVFLIGNLGQDIEVKTTQSGHPVATLSVATTKRYTDRDGNQQSQTVWHKVQVWDKLAENCARFLHKGSAVFVEGELVQNKYQDKNGIDRTSIEVRASNVQFLDPRNGDQSHQYAPAQQAAGSEFKMDEDVPF